MSTALRRVLRETALRHLRRIHGEKKGQVILLLSRGRRLLAGYPELVAVLAAALLGLTLRPPLACAASHQGINILLAVLVFATAVTVEFRALRRLFSTWRRLLIRAGRAR